MRTRTPVSLFAFPNLHFNLFPDRIALSGAVALLLVLVYVLKKKKYGGEIEETDFVNIISVFIYSGGMCESAFFLYCAFHPDSLKYMPEYPWLIMVGAMSMGFHAWMQLKAIGEEDSIFTEYTSVVRSELPPAAEDNAEN